MSKLETVGEGQLRRRQERQKLEQRVAKKKMLLNATVWLLIFLCVVALVFTNRKRIAGWIKEDERKAMVARKANQALLFRPGEMVVIRGELYGVVNKECWFTFNNYEIRLENGEMTMARGSELKPR